jgi:hypothetical protein
MDSMIDYPKKKHFRYEKTLLPMKTYQLTRKERFYIIEYIQFRTKLRSQITVSA